MARAGNAPRAVIRFYSVSDEYGEFSELGRILMAVRERLRSESDDQAGVES